MWRHTRWQEGEGVKKSWNSCHVIYGWPLILRSFLFFITLDSQLIFYRCQCYNIRVHCPLLQYLLTTSTILAGAHSYFVVGLSFKCEGKNSCHDLITNPLIILHRLLHYKKRGLILKTGNRSDRLAGRWHLVRGHMCWSHHVYPGSCNTCSSSCAPTSHPCGRHPHANPLCINHCDTLSVSLSAVSNQITPSIYEVWGLSHCKYIARLIDHEET